MPGFVADTPALKLMQGMLASRVAAMVIVLAVALFTRSPRMLALALFMRLLTEVQDAAAILTSGGMGNQATAFVTIIVVIMVLEAVGIWKLLQMDRQAAGKTP